MNNKLKLMGLTLFLSLVNYSIVVKEDISLLEYQSFGLNLGKFKGFGVNPSLSIDNIGKSININSKLGISYKW